MYQVGDKVVITFVNGAYANLPMDDPSRICNVVSARSKTTHPDIIFTDFISLYDGKLAAWHTSNLKPNLLIHI